MPTSEFTREALFEHRFWLQILGDHARFLIHMISIEDQEDMQKAFQYKDVFDQFLQRARKNIEGVELATLTGQALQAANEFRSFKLLLLEKGIEGKIHISTTFISHMVNELEEYLRILSFLHGGKIPPYGHPLHHHLLWISDAAGHAWSIESSLDMIEKKYIEKSRQFHKIFDDMYLKAIELAGYLRSGLEQFPALSRYNRDAALEIEIFKGFLEEVERLDLHAELLGPLMPLVLDHMGREECYYLIKLARSTGGKIPECDPAKPRVE